MNIGLGDIIGMITARMGMYPTENCGCDKRKALLNQLFPRIAIHADAKDSRKPPTRTVVPIEHTSEEFSL